jgi:glycosyltransferase involved in cell wall biosynthesis
VLTVLIASHNGARTLAPVLETFTQLQAPASGWKLVVVDNASTDQTRDILGKFCQKLPLTIVVEQRLGKNAALNTGLEFADGDLAVFADDDVFPKSDWLLRLRDAADANPAYCMFGGVIRARWEIPPPAWVNWVNQAPVFTVTDPCLTEGPTSPGSIFGPNMAVRMEIFARGIRFDPSIGPAGGNYAMGSESELLERLGRLGHKAWHAQSAVVEHFVRDFQLEESWALRRAIRHGRGSYRLQYATMATPPWPLYVVPRIIKRLLRIAKASLVSDKKGAFCARCDLNYLWGYLVEARLMRRQRHS